VRRWQLGDGSRTITISHCMVRGWIILRVGSSPESPEYVCELHEKWSKTWRQIQAFQNKMEL
jgi:hypothetical protein